MTRQVVSSPLAEEDLQGISEYIAQRNPVAAKRFLKYIRKTFATLAALPGLGAAWEGTRIPDLRFWPLPRYKNYVIFYCPINNGVEILRVVHGARDLSKLFETTD